MRRGLFLKVFDSIFFFFWQRVGGFFMINLHFFFFVGKGRVFSFLFSFLKTYLCDSDGEKLRRIGNCPQGFIWMRENGGWRCAGGTHFVSRLQFDQN